MSSAYSTVIEPVLGRLPAQAAAAAGDSVGATLQIAQNAGPQGELLAQAHARPSSADWAVRCGWRSVWPWWASR